MGISAPPLLTDEHQINAFQCGIEELDTWLRKQALKSQKRGTARVYVVNDTDTHQVVGYMPIYRQSQTYYNHLSLSLPKKTTYIY